MSEEQASSTQIGSFVWEVGRELATLRRREARKASGRPIHYAALFAILLAWSALLWILPGPGLMLFVTFVMFAATAFAAWLCVDFQKAKGCATMRESIALGLSAETTYRERGLRLRIDGHDVPIAPDGRLVHATWATRARGETVKRYELSLVNDGRVLVIADGNEEEIDRVTRLLSETSRGLLGVQRVTGGEWMGGGCSGCLLQPLIYLSGLGALFVAFEGVMALSATAPRPLLALVTLPGMFGLMVLSTINLLAAIYSSGASQMLKEVYGVTDSRRRPFFRRPWPAIALTVAAAFGAYELRAHGMPGSPRFFSNAPAGSARTPPPR